MLLKSIFTGLISLISLVFSLHASASLPINFLYEELSGYSDDFTQQDFDYVISQVEKVFSPIIEARGGKLEIIHDWGDGAVNAFAWREGSYYMLEILGGLPRHELITKDAFALLVCHELGHLLGGIPLSYGISYEGQSDYYATLECTELLFPSLNWSSKRVDIPASVLSKCEDSICERSLMASQSLANLFALVGKEAKPSTLKKDPTVVRRTIQKHTNAQCRLDTLVAGAFCRQQLKGQGNSSLCEKGFQRPRCWYRENP